MIGPIGLEYQLSCTRRRFATVKLSPGHEFFRTIILEDNATYCGVMRGGASPVDITALCHEMATILDERSSLQRRAQTILDGYCGSHRFLHKCKRYLGFAPPVHSSIS